MVRVHDDVIYPEVQCARRDGLRCTRFALVCCTEHDLGRVRVRIRVRVIGLIELGFRFGFRVRVKVRDRVRLRVLIRVRVRGTTRPLPSACSLACSARIACAMNEAA